MKKFLVMFALAAVFVIQMTPAFAKEVYVGTKYGLEFYIDTLSIQYAYGNEFYVTVNEYLGDTLKDSNEWKFYNESFSGRGTWYFDYEYLGTKIPVSSEPLAGNILETCRTYETRISR